MGTGNNEINTKSNNCKLVFYLDYTCFKYSIFNTDSNCFEYMKEHKIHPTHESFEEQITKIITTENNLNKAYDI